MADSYEKRLRAKRKAQRKREKAEKRRRDREAGLLKPPDEMSPEEAWYGPDGKPDDVDQDE